MSRGIPEPSSATQARRRRYLLPSAISTSFLLHAGMIGAGAWLFARLQDSAAPAAVQPVAQLEVELELPPGAIELPVMGASGVSNRLRPDVELRPEPDVPSGGGSELPRPDLDRTGRGGDASARERALNLSDSIDPLSLTRDALNTLERSQVQRLDTAKRRQSRDDRRATPNPMHLFFVASGDGRRHERREYSPWDPSRGSAQGARALQQGGELGGERRDGEEPEPGREGTDRHGNADATSAGAGVADGARGEALRRRAHIALARPAVTRSRAAVPARAKGRPSDNTESRQEVANAVRSLIHASAAGGPSGSGRGGEVGPGNALGSAGQVGPGSRSTAAGRGGGVPVAITDAGLTDYTSRLERAIDWADAFPKWAIEEGRAGVAIISFTIDREGRISQISVLRPSGVAEFDRGLVLALHRGAPYPRLPAMLGAAARFNMTFDALNPVVSPPR